MKYAYTIYDQDGQIIEWSESLYRTPQEAGRAGRRYINDLGYDDHDVGVMDDE